MIEFFSLNDRVFLEVAKKLICGDEWNTKILPQASAAKWKLFLQSISCIDKNGEPKRNVSYLLDFAGYKEQEEKLIEAGEDITPIETASHYREAKKATPKSEPIEQTLPKVDWCRKLSEEEVV